jgi:Ni/Co efflux regulator RcnB
MLIAALAATTAATGAMSGGVAAAQSYDHRYDRQQYDQNHNDHHWRYYGGRYGYEGYSGRWRTGQRYPYWRDQRYMINDWRAYHLPPPQPGYAYYGDPNGDIVMAALASGVIGLIVGGALADHGHYHY